jgi:hypothetical protein
MIKTIGLFTRRGQRGRGTDSGYTGQITEKQNDNEGKF